MTDANAADLWDRIWESEGVDAWRSKALSQVYTRIERAIPMDSEVVDLGGGVGDLAARLAETRGCLAEVWDHSAAALAKAEERGLCVYNVDLEDDARLPVYKGFVVATEVVEHLSAEAREFVFYWASKHARGAFISVPNDRLGPDEEPQHTIKFTAKSFLDALRKHWGEDVRVEALGPYLLGVCGEPAKKSYRLSMTLPVRDEEADLARTLASFRGVADEIVVGIDPRTKDATREVAEKYADVIFELESPRGPEGEEVEAEDGVHFAWVRNQCIDRCTGDWIFMSEGHEHLQTGHEVLMNLDQLNATVAYVLRQGTGQQWAFPWLFRRSDSIRFTRAVHNMLNFPAGTHVVRLPQVRTMHDRDHGRSVTRAVQRHSQNRLHLMEDWRTHGDKNSLFYLAGEYREIRPDKAVELMGEFLRVSNNGVQRYQARLILAKEHAKNRRFEEAREILIGAAGDDWSRSEHYVWLGDMAALQDRWDEAHRWYSIATVTIGHPPFAVWFIDLDVYSYLPAQRMATACGELGKIEEGLGWARQVVDLLPGDAPAEMFDQARENVKMYEEHQTC